MASAVSAKNQPRERELVLHPPNLILGTSTQQLLNVVPTFAGHQWFVRGLVCGAIPLEIAHVQSFAQNVMDGTLVELRATQGHAIGAKLGNKGIERVPACREPFKQLANDPAPPVDPEQ